MPAPHAQRGCTGRNLAGEAPCGAFIKVMASAMVRDRALSSGTGEQETTCFVAVGEFQMQASSRNRSFVQHLRIFCLTPRRSAHRTGEFGTSPFVEESRTQVRRLFSQAPEGAPDCAVIFAKN
jgi:hypothetical protein